jgi:hypothetical protein
LTRLLLLLSLPEEIIQGRIDPPLINVAPDRAIGSSNPISPVFPHDLHTVYGGPFPSVFPMERTKGLLNARGIIRHFHLLLLQSSSASRFTAGCCGFLFLIQCRERPET